MSWMSLKQTFSSVVRACRLLTLQLSRNKVKLYKKLLPSSSSFLSYLFYLFIALPFANNINKTRRKFSTSFLFSSTFSHSILIINLHIIPHFIIFEFKY